MFNDLPYIRPIKPTPAERPLLTAADFMKDGPWWVREDDASKIYRMVYSVSERGVKADCLELSYQCMRDTGVQRTNNGEHWENC